MAKPSGTDPAGHRTPTWVKYTVIAGIVLLTGVAAMMMAGGHGPWQHEAPAHTPVAGG